MKRTFGRFTTTIILGMILALMMATMASAAIPQTIFYTNAAGQIVEANYQMAIEAAGDGDINMLLAIKNAIRTAQDNFRDIVVLTADDKIINWSTALDDNMGFVQAQIISTYLLTVTPTPAKYMQTNGTEGNQPPGSEPVWPIQVDKVTVTADLSGDTVVEVIVKPGYVNSIGAITINNLAAVKSPTDPAKWRKTLDGALTLDDLTIVVTTSVWPIQVDNVTVTLDPVGNTVVEVIVKPDYVNSIGAITINDRAAAVLPTDPAKWRATLNGALTLGDLTIVVTTADGTTDFRVVSIE